MIFAFFALALEVELTSLNAVDHAGPENIISPLAGNLFIYTTLSSRAHWPKPHEKTLGTNASNWAVEQIPSLLPKCIERSRKAVKLEC